MARFTTATTLKSIIRLAATASFVTAVSIGATTASASTHLVDANGCVSVPATLHGYHLDGSLASGVTLQITTTSCSGPPSPSVSSGSTRAPSRSRSSHDSGHSKEFARLTHITFLSRPCALHTGGISTSYNGSGGHVNLSCGQGQSFYAQAQNSYAEASAHTGGNFRVYFTYQGQPLYSDSSYLNCFNQNIYPSAPQCTLGLQGNQSTSTQYTGVSWIYDNTSPNLVPSYLVSSNTYCV